MSGTEKFKTAYSVKIEKTGSHAKKTLLYSYERGSILIGLIIAMVIMAILGTGMVYLTTTSTFNELFANNNARAYYTAESGGRYAMALIRDAYATDTNKLNAINANQTFTLSDGNSFQITNWVQDGSSPETITFTIVSTVGSGFLQAKKTLKYSIQPANQSASGGGYTPIQLDFSNAGTYDQNFDTVHMKKVNDDGNGYFSIQLHDTTNEGLMAIKSSVSPQASGGLLSYNAQIKLHLDTSGGYGHEFMVGISFRMSQYDSTDTDINEYGVSFFRSDSNPGNLPTTFNALKDNSLYVVLWKRINLVYSLINYKKMDASYNVCSGNCTDLGFADWSTLLVSIKERMNGGSKENVISAYVQGASVYPQGTLDWNFTTKKPVFTNLVDSSLHSNDYEYDSANPHEIGLHVFYDSNNNGKVMFSDFGLSQGGGSAGGGSGTIIQSP